MTFSHELAQARLDWRHAYIMTSYARIPPPLYATLRHPRKKGWSAPMLLLTTSYLRLTDTYF